jgi:hypothetical protein
MHNEDLIKYFFKFYNENFYTDLYLPKYKPIEGTQSKDKYINSTIALFTSNHDFKINTQEIKKIYSHIVDKDTVISLDNNLILKELYRILLHLFQYDICLQLDRDKEYQAIKFTSIYKNKNKLKKEVKDLKTVVLKPYIENTNEVSFYWKLYFLYYKDREVFDHFLNMIALHDLELMKINEVDLEYMHYIKKAVGDFSSQQSMPKDIVKSAGIIIYYHLRKFLKVSNKKALDIADYLIKEFYNEQFSHENLTKNIYIRSLVGGIPIFGSTENVYPSVSKRKFIQHLIEKDMDFGIDDKDVIDNSFESMFNNTHITYLFKYPVEFFYKNEKYSS